MAKRVDITILPGTNPVPDDTELETLYYTDTDKVYFWNGKLRKIPGWVSVIFSNSQTIRGAARTLYSYISTIAHTIIGTNTRLYTFENGALYNITPLLTSTTAIANSLATDYVALANNPIATTNGSKDIVATSSTHKLETGDSVTLSGASTTNGIPNTQINTTFVVRATTTNTFTVTVATTAATSTGSGGGASVIARTAIIRVTAAAHGMLDGDRVKIAAAATTGGVLDTEINAEHIIRNIAAGTFDIVCSTKATSSVSGGGGASTTYQKQIAKGPIDFSQGLGYGGGKYGVGLYGVAKAFTNVYTYPRIWSWDRFGNDIVGTPGGGGKIYIWQNDTAEAPTILSGAPTTVDYVFVAGNAVVALYGNNIKASDTGDATNWTVGPASNAYDDDVEGAGRFISHAKVGNTNLIFTENEVFTFSSVGKPDIWDLEDLYKSDGLIAPKARREIGNSVFWWGQGAFYSYDGGSVNELEGIECLKWIYDNLNYQQRWKIHTWVDITKNIVGFCFPTIGNNECNKELLYNYKEKHGTLSNIPRTAAEDPIATITSPYRVNSTSESVDGTLYRHNYGHDDDGSAMTAFAESNYVMIGEGDDTMEIMEIVPDSTQIGNVDLTIYTKDWAQDTEEFTWGPYTITPTTKFIDPQAAGRQRKYRFEQNALGEDFAMGKWFENIQKGPPL